MEGKIINHLVGRGLVVLLGMLLFITGCDQELAEMEEEKVLRKLSVQEKELINSTNHLSLDILRTEFDLNNQQNVFFSPVSIGMTLGMVYNGVGEKEKSQIQHIMGLESLLEKEINKSYNELISFLQVSTDQMDISYANSLWFSTDIDINEDFRSRVMAYYDAEISELNFKKSSSAEYINSWGNLKTRGTFGKLIENAPATNTDIFFVNAFGLNSGWSNNSQTFYAENEFMKINGEAAKVNTINWDGLKVKYSDLESYSFVEIPLESSKFHLSVIQPKNLEDLLDLFGLLATDRDCEQESVEVPCPHPCIEPVAWLGTPHLRPTHRLYS